MRALPYFILAYVILGLQVGVGRYTAFHGASPNLALLGVVFISLNARQNAALLGSFAIGLAQDLLTLQPPGLYALSYGLVAMLIVALQQIVKRTHPLTHFALALTGGLLTALILIVHGSIHPPGGALVIEGKVALRPERIAAGVEFTRALYTAVLAPPVLWGLGRIRAVFAFQPGRRR